MNTEQIISKIEAIAYLIDCVGVAVVLTGVPSDDRLLAVATAYLSDELIDTAQDLLKAEEARCTE